LETIAIAGLEQAVSRIGLGTWALGGWVRGEVDEADAISTIHAALDLGVNIIDTAPAYGQGRSEELIGKALKLRGGRDQVILATKVGLEWEGGSVRRNSTRARVLFEIEQSLRRLETDYIDIYQVHWPDPLVPMVETASTLEELRRSGKIRAIGVSNFSPAQMDGFRRAAPLHTAQPPYNLFERDAEADILPYCQREGITTLTYGVLCRGLLSGRMKFDTRFGENDVRQQDPKFHPPRYGQYLKAVQQLDQIARSKYHKRVLHLAVRWVLDRPGVGVALWGARRPEQLSSIGEVTGFALDQATLADINKIESVITDPVGPDFMAPATRG